MLAFLDKIPYGTPRIRRVAFWMLSVFIAYVIFGFLILPPIVKSIIISQAEEGLKRTTTVEKVYFNPLTLHIEVDGFQIAKKEGKGNLLSVDSLLASPSLSSIWKFAPVISYLHLRNLAVDIAFLGDGKYSFSDLIGAKQEVKKIEEEAEEGAIFPFALYGFEMTNATIVFDDRPREKMHTITNLDLIVPFTSSFQDLKKEFTQPKFKAVVNGDPVELKGRTLPFDETLLTEFELGAINIDLDQYWRYLPVESTLQLTKGRFSSDLSLFFERPDAQRISLFLGGGGRLHDLELTAPGDNKVLALNNLEFEMERFSLGDNALNLKRINLDTPYFKIIRHKNNVINWTKYFPGSRVTEEGAEIKTTGSDAPFLLDVQDIQVSNGLILWKDRTISEQFEYKFHDVTINAKEVSTHGEKPCTFDISLGDKTVLGLQGNATLKPLAARATFSVAKMQLPHFQPYLDQLLSVELESGVLDLSVDIDAMIDADKRSAVASNGSVTLSDLAIRKVGAKEPSIGLTELAITGGTADLNAQVAEVAEVSVTGPMVNILKEKNGSIDLAAMFASKGSDAAPGNEEKSETAPQAKPWTTTIKSLKLAEGSASFRDLGLKHPTSLSIDGLQGEINNITTKKGETLTHNISTRWAKRGKISLNGKLDLDTMKGSGKLTVRSMALRPFDGHLGEFTELLFASGSAAADIKYVFELGDKPKVNASGAFGLHKVQLKDTTGGGEIAGINAFKLNGIQFSNEPYRLSIASIHLDGPKAAISFNENGRLNIKQALGIPEPPPMTEEEKKLMAEQAKKKHEKQVAEKKEPEPSFFDKLDIGKITMENGHVSFRDATVSPVYMVNITDMKLGLIEVSQSPDARPKLDFSAKIGPTPMSVTGVVNPAITPMYSDLAIAVNGMELVPVSPYTVQHLAYPIAKGRLYADVKFKTENWDLDASNKFFIEQLELGAKDKRPDAPNVPVKFGLALLQDGNGDMELNLPIKGRLDDPDFKIGGIVFKAIASLFIKALASPFTLIGSIFGGGGENMDFVVFQPGRYELDAAGVEKLQATVTALQKRSKLKLDVDGVIDPIVDKRGLVEEIFKHKLRQQKFDSLTRKERATTTVDAMVIAPEEYEEFLFEAYADEPDEEGIKPTTLFMTDRMPVDFMEQFILDRIVVTEEDLQALANRRANAIKTHIIAQDEALTQRVFLLDERKNRKGKTGVPMHRADLGIQ